MVRKAIVVVALAAGVALAAQDLAKFVGDDLAKIKAAAPATAPARPARPRKILVFTESARDLETARRISGMKFVPHPSAPHCALAVAALGEKTGAFQATITSDPRAFAPERLAAYDAIVLANVYLESKLYKTPRDLRPQEKPVFEARQKALLDFVRGGKGLVALHNAACPALDWPEYNRMVGGTHFGHAWFSHQGVPIKLDDPSSPLNAPFGGKGFTINDDIYVFTAPYSRAALHVLLSVDTAKAPPSMTADRADGDYPVSWIKTYGQGRVFYTVLGHEAATFQNPKFLAHLLAGIQFATGDLKADTSPGKPLPPKPGFAIMAGWTPLFDGTSLDAWQLSPQQAKHWVVKDGVLCFDGNAATLRTKKSFKNYMLRVDFRMPRRGDSGVFVRDNKQLNIWTWHMGSGEMWEHRGRAKTEEERRQYIPKSREDRPVGEWNTFIITVKDDRVTAILNGKEVISQAKLVGVRPESPIGLQRHGDPLEFKCIYVKELP